MIGWVTASAPHVSWCRFTGFGQRLYVANANREIPENTLGTDLIYFNATRQSLVLVQYKRMDSRKGVITTRTAMMGWQPSWSAWRR
jgi:hypothetical protein